MDHCYPSRITHVLYLYVLESQQIVACHDMFHFQYLHH
ncbi:hypothetical protein BMETH_1086_0 [methanotrophic bacterial endosymbiont of Bathymodiolus sp.]|nr:hypothetical protein BMETH_1086_0 [methanotrophic bacterial endosymbiont of Bathymodiolus sp.]